MPERSARRSRKRSSLARKFLGLGRLNGGVPSIWTAKNIVVCLGLSLVMTALLVEYKFQSVPEYGVGDIADQTVVSPESFTVVDEEATREKRVRKTVGYSASTVRHD